MKTLGWLLCALCITLTACVTPNTVTEEDRKVIHYNREAWAMAAAVSATVGADPAAQISAVALVAAKYGAPLSAHLVKVYGPPQVAPEPISEAAIKDAIAGSTKAHSAPWWQTVGLTIMGLVPVLLGIGSKFARYLPGGAAIYDVAAASFGAIESVMAASKKTGGSITVDAIEVALEAAHNDPRLKPVAMKILAEAQKKLGLAEKLAA